MAPVVFWVGGFHDSVALPEEPVLTRMPNTGNVEYAPLVSLTPIVMLP